MNTDIILSSCKSLGNLDDLEGLDGIYPLLDWNKNGNQRHPLTARIHFQTTSLKVYMKQL